MTILDKDYWMSYKGLAWVLLGCILLFAIGYSLTWSFDSPNEAGDTAGLVNGLFSALAFAGVIYAIFLQRNELELQRKELSQTREEFKEQNRTMKLQRFENTFFNMLQLQQQIVETISYQERSTERLELRGRAVFYHMFENITLTSSKEDDIRSPYQGMRALLKYGGINEYEENHTPSHFDHYFRHLYRIIKFIDCSELIEHADRYTYASIVRAQLSRYELIWLYYNGISIYGKEKFKPVIEKYALLKNLREDLLATGTNPQNDYKPGAFRHISTPWRG